MDLIEKLADLVGFYRSYTGTFGDQVFATNEARKALLSAMGYKLDQQSLEIAINVLEQNKWLNTLPCVHIKKSNIESHCITVTLPKKSQQSVSWRIITESCNEVSGTVELNTLEIIDEKTINEQIFYQYNFPLPTLELGYHSFILTLPDAEIKCPLIYAPDKCFSPKAASNKKVWGYTAQLYSLKSEENWGIGDFTDLKNLINQSVQSGASIVGINPLHPLYQNNPAHRSPYSPSSRCFLNPLYINVTSIFNFSACKKAQNLINDEVFTKALADCRQSNLIDYPAVAELKYPVIELLFEDFCDNETSNYAHQASSFNEFKQAYGNDLIQFATFDALYEHFRNIDQNCYSWAQWPEEYQTPSGEAVVKFQQDNAKRIDYFCYLQWLAHTQLTEVKNSAQTKGMKIGLYLDLAVGCDGSGTEVWSDQSLYLAGASIGAPPDDMNLLGQNWGLTPMNPVNLQEKGYQPLVKALRSNMQYSGALRIDHILGLMRQYWIAPNMPADQGMYISFPIDDILSIIALESQRAKCIVIGEDLGNVPDGFGELINNAGLLSFKVMFFERWASGLFKRPEMFSEQSIVTIATHDTATLAGWWTGQDLAWREKLDIYPSKEAGEQDRNARAGERQMLIDALDDLGVIDRSKAPSPTQLPAEMNTELTLAVQKYLAQAHSHIQLIPLEDALESAEQVNIPGTIDEHPNWLQKLPVTLNEFWQQPSVVELVNTMKIYRPVD